MAKHKVRSKQTVPENETKSDRFVRVVTPRVGKAVKAIRVIGYCAGTPYEYTPKQVEKISEALMSAMNQLADRFASKKPEQDEFDFS